MSRWATTRKRQKRAQGRLSDTVVPSNEAEYNNVAANLGFWRNVSRGGGVEKDETCSGNVIGPEHVRGIGRTNEDDMSLCEHRRDGLEKVKGKLRSACGAVEGRNINADQDEGKEESDWAHDWTRERAMGNDDGVGRVKDGEATKEANARRGSQVPKYVLYVTRNSRCRR